MALILKNPNRGRGLPALKPLLNGSCLIADPSSAKALYARCPAADTTPLVSLDGLSTELSVAAIHAKDERGRMGLGSFKALGAAFAIAKMAAARSDVNDDLSHALAGETFACSSAGNHGLSIAVGANVFGANAVIYLSESVPEAFAVRLREKGAKVVREGTDYESSLAGAVRDAEANGWQLLSDSSWPGYTDLTRDIMEGYLLMAAEAGDQLDEPPSHIFLQAGVGGLAASCAVMARRLWGDAPKICVVEPEFAPALLASIEAGKIVNAPGPVSSMGRLDCKEPSLLALDALATHADVFMAVAEQDASDAVAALAQHGMDSTPSGTAGLAGLMVGLRVGDDDICGLDLSAQSRVLIYVSEGPEDG